jgi:RNA polymerase sigma-70 factor (ECF subfamily)
MAASAAEQAGKPTDPQIAHIVYTANLLDIEAAKQALQKSKNEGVRAFAQQMVGDHTTVNNQALALVKKLNVTPEDNPTSQSLKKQADATRNKLASLNGAAFDKAYRQRGGLSQDGQQRAQRHAHSERAERRAQSVAAERPGLIPGAPKACRATRQSAPIRLGLAVGSMTSVALDYETLTDIELAKLIAQRDSLAVRVVTRRNNQRLYRTAWSVLKDRADAEETVQEGYLKGFAAIDSFAGASSLSTWLTRIVLNEALGRRRSAQRKIRLLREQSIALINDYLVGGSAAFSSPEADAARGQVAKLLEQAIADLPEAFRIVFMLREVEGLSVEETAEALQIPPQTVKTRLLRARRRLQAALAPTLQDALRGAFPFAGEACEALTERVLANL